MTFESVLTDKELTASSVKFQGQDCISSGTERWKWRDMDFHRLSSWSVLWTLLKPTSSCCLFLFPQATDTPEDRNNPVLLYNKMPLETLNTNFTLKINSIVWNTHLHCEQPVTGQKEDMRLLNPVMCIIRSQISDIQLIPCSTEYGHSVAESQACDYVYNIIYQCINGPNKTVLHVLNETKHDKSVHF